MHSLESSSALVSAMTFYPTVFCDAQPRAFAHLRAEAGHDCNCYPLHEDRERKVRKDPHLPKEGRYGPQDRKLTLVAKSLFHRNVRDDEEFIQELKYIHRNPVKRGLVENPEDWPWSSYRHYALDEQGIVAVESPWPAYKRKHPSADRNQLSRIFARDD